MVSVQSEGKDGSGISVQSVSRAATRTRPVTSSVIPLNSTVTTTMEPLVQKILVVGGNGFIGTLSADMKHSRYRTSFASQAPPSAKRL